MNTLDCKDANDVLIKHGAEKLRELVLGAEPIPLHGLNNLDHYADEFQDLYDKGMPTGVSTGYATVDKIFTLSTPNLVVGTVVGRHVTVLLKNQYNFMQYSYLNY